ncbi:hypothetical protein [Algicola sagamiensis]|uniref:hypothetical protein n=1 Tax=Algicola sagamiensis TaxID=163869 RepID=UPI00036CF680|nr:hypothetical protein [Algicola sagamiensis]
MKAITLRTYMLLSLLLLTLGACSLGPKEQTGFAQSTQGSFPLTQTQVQEIQAIPHGERPAPSTYLPQSYIRIHLSYFQAGASYLVSKAALDRWGRNPVGRPDGQFVSTKSDIDNLLKKTQGDLALIEEELGIPAGTWQGKPFVRIDIPQPSQFHLRLPSGNESGANTLWIPGGRLPTGKLEAVVNPIPQGAYVETALPIAVKSVNQQQ